MAQIPKKKLQATRISKYLKVDGLLDEPEWKTTAVADSFVSLRPTPFLNESKDNRSEVYFLYNTEGIYVGGYFHEKNKDSIAAELIGRDGFGNNDFVGIIFDTYQDKLNGFEYFVTPLGEQMDAKVAPNNNGNNEDFSWNAVWESGAKINNDGWSFEMFIPFAAIRFGKMKIQDWGLNIVRRRQKSGGQLFWQSIDPTVNGFLTQEGTLTGLQDIKPPLRLQFSPYFSVYHDKPTGTKSFQSRFNGGADVKYGINQAFTLDMTLIPDFGQVVTDNRILNLSPFAVRFNENRPFFTEGVELFNKGNLFYSRRIGVEPLYHKYDFQSNDEILTEDPQQAKIINATKISGRTQKGFGLGVLNAVTSSQRSKYYNTSTGKERESESQPLTNYNVFVVDQTMKNNSSVSFVNTNVMRSGNDYDANVSAFLFDLNDKKNTWNVGGNVSVSQLMGSKTTVGYAHSIYFGKTSGRFNFNVWQELYDKKYDKSDLGFFTNNNTMDQGIWAGYRWIKPKGWYNSLNMNINGWYSRLVTPIDNLKRTEMMYQGAGGNVNLNAQTKKLWWIGANINAGARRNDFYEPREMGRVFKNKGRIGLNTWWNSNDAKKFSWGGNGSLGTGGVFKRKIYEIGLYGKIRFNSKLSIDNSINNNVTKDGDGWAGRNTDGAIIFARRDVTVVENVLGAKYNFNNKMGITLRTRHYWSKVLPQQFYELNPTGDLVTPTTTFTKNVNQNYNFMSVDMVYTWQFAQGSFINIVWKNIGDNFERSFEKNYFANLNKIVSNEQSTSFSLRVIYFLDYLTAKKQLSKKK